jgi:hypothetical protein
MKKFLVLGVLAAAVMAFSHQRASAWGEVKFGVGLTFSAKGGGNSLLWGAWKSQQPPPAVGGFTGYPYDGGYGFGGHAANTTGSSGYGIAGYGAGNAATATKMQPVSYQSWYYGQTGSQPVSYYPYGGYGYGYGAAPSYWYGW